MSNKEWSKVNELDKLIRQTTRLGMQNNGVYLKIEFIWGFELFNTHAYHNYETWSGGYRVTDDYWGVTVEREDLDDAIKAWAKLVEQKRTTRKTVVCWDCKGYGVIGDQPPREPCKMCRKTGWVIVPIDDGGSTDK